MNNINNRCSNLKVRKFENGGVVVMYNWWEGDKIMELEAAYASEEEAAQDISDFVTASGEWEE